jgi:hypothetical protein
MSMNSFSEQKSYRAALLNTKSELSAEQGNDSATKRKGEVAHAAPPTVPTVPRTVPSPVTKNSPSSLSDAFTTPSKSPAKKNKPARAAAMTSPPKALNLKNITRNQPNGSSSAAEVASRKANIAPAPKASTSQAPPAPAIKRKKRGETKNAKPAEQEASTQQETFWSSSTATASEKFSLLQAKLKSL